MIDIPIYPYSSTPIPLLLSPRAREEGTGPIGKKRIYKKRPGNIEDRYILLTHP